MRRTLFALICLGLTFAVSAPAGPRAPAPALAPVTATTFVASGRGWGHGVGMSQYGALGYANDGWTYDQILAHFYTGAELGPAPVARVRVLVAESRASLTVSSPVPFRVRDLFGKTYPLQAGDVVLGPKLRVSVNGAPTELVGPILFLPGSSPLSLDGGHAYRGQLEVGVNGQKLSAINSIGLEQYLAGVVPREMPSAWPAEALKAQAVAARSYALAHRLGGKGFDLYADVRSQVYGGVGAEHPAATAAIEATAAEVLLWEGKPIDALFHSTSGGKTLAAEEVFGKAVPYLTAVDDPHSALSPVNRWGPTPIPESAIRKGLKLRSPVTALKLTRGASGRVVSVQAVTASGTATVSGAALRAATGLRSTWITSWGSLSLTRPGGTAVFGKPLAIAGKAQGIKGAVLSQRSDGAWRPLAGLSVKVKLLAPTSFRISAGKVAGPVLKVPVAPLVRLAATARNLSGTVKPLTGGTSVEVQQLLDGTWATVLEATADETGRFTALAPQPGVYRARTAPVQGFAEGLSGQLEVP
ncbi:MAG TPA: SpoIID/LytB domain-containing protein [Gaiellaceae bacterium]|nr:SpoIID/LytB domain-containing protein [Gaiellaceae bacterium]